jgi:hypothetical protein
MLVTAAQAGQKIPARKRVGIFRRLVMLPRKHHPFERHSTTPGYVDQKLSYFIDEPITFWMKLLAVITRGEASQYIAIAVVHPPNRGSACACSSVDQLSWPTWWMASR